MKARLEDDFGNIYCGETKNGIPHGFGSLLWKDTGHILKCRWKENKPVAPFLIKIPDLATYHGDIIFKKDEKGMFDYEMTGKGRIDYEDGDYYIGGFDKGSFHGRGKIFYSSGDYLEGKWFYGRPDGDMLYKTSAFKYKGPMAINGLKEFTCNGYGKSFFADGSVYDGGFKYNTFDGIGTFKFANGQTVDALWRDSKPIGIVKCRLKKGQEYVGEVTWPQVRPNGRGVLSDRSGEPLAAGIWKDGVLVSPDNRINVVDLLFEKQKQNMQEISK